MGRERGWAIDKQMQVVWHYFKRKNSAIVLSTNFVDDLVKAHPESIYPNLTATFGTPD
jgi:hypothetical protein